MKELLKTEDGKKFIQTLKNIPSGTVMSFKHWANTFTKQDDGTWKNKFEGKSVSNVKFALDRISNNSTTGIEFELK